MTVVAIMQPTYLPWCGYFDLMDQADVFVILDNVQFSYQSWQHRNRIRTRDGLAWLTVPVITKNRHGQVIADVEIARTTPFPDNHVHLLELNYGRAAHVRYLEALISLVRGGAATSRLTALTVPLIIHLAHEFGIDTPIVRSSELKVAGTRSELLTAICADLGANEYLSPPGSVDYLAQDAHLFADAGIEVFIHAYEHPQYRQQWEPFLPFASAIDLLLNEGEGASSILRSGSRPQIPLIAWSS
jgi:hypothetical protein